MTTPSQPPPSGNYIYAYGLQPGVQSVKHQQTDWTTQTIQSALGAAGGITGSWTNAQNSHNQLVKQPIIDNANQIGQSATTLTGHENRITQLEGGGQIATYYTNDTWHKPSGYSYHHVICVGGGGGGQGGQDATSSTGYGGQGGGQGGWRKTDFADSALTSSSYTVTIGVGGIGGLSYYREDFQRADSSTLGSNWRCDSTYSGDRAVPSLKSHHAEAGLLQDGDGLWGYWATYTGGELGSDNVSVEATITSPVRTESADDNHQFGVYLAAPTTYSGSTKVVGFIATQNATSNACGIVTQTNAPSAPFYFRGNQSGQTLAASSSTTIKHGDVMKLKRVGNVFTAYKNDVQVMSWTDSGNTVPTGAGNRHFGLYVTGEYDSGDIQRDSATIGLIVARDLDATAGTATTLTDGATTVTAGGGAAGSVYNASGPASNGSGNQTSVSAAGGQGGNASSSSYAGTAGGNGVGCNGGAGGANAGNPGSDGQNLPTAQYGPGGGGGGGAGSTSSEGGKGGNCGFPGGGGGGGGATSTVGSAAGGGGAGGAGITFVISNNSAT